jgi:molecular chaperone DnaK (HSP70)
MAAAKKGGVTVICDETTKRFTPNMVGFGNAERLIGQTAFGKITRNFKNTV